MKSKQYWRLQFDKEAEYFEVVTPPRGPTPEPITLPPLMSLLESLGTSPSGVRRPRRRRSSTLNQEREKQFLLGLEMVGSGIKGDEDDVEREDLGNEVEKSEVAKRKASKSTVAKPKATKLKVTKPKVAKQRAIKSELNMASTTTTQATWTPSSNSSTGINKPKCPRCKRMKTSKQCVGGPPCGLCVEKGRSAEQCQTQSRDEVFVKGLKISLVFKGNKEEELV